MADFKVVINDGKGKKSYTKKLEQNPLVGKKILETFDGTLIGLDGYELQITGGADNTGTAMRRDVPGNAKKKILIVSGIGLRKNRAGRKVRKTVAGNTVAEKTSMINAKITKYGKISLEEALGLKKEEAKAEAPKEAPAKEEKPAEVKAAA